MLSLDKFVPVMETLMTMNVNSRTLHVNNKNRFKLNTKDLAVSTASLMFNVLMSFFMFCTSNMLVILLIVVNVFIKVIETD